MMQWIQKLLWHSLTMSIIVLAYHAAVIGLGKRYATKWFYLVGVILLVGFLIPFRPVIAVEMGKMPEFLQAAAISEGSGQASTTAATQSSWETPQGFPWAIAFILWAFGALATILYHGIKHIWFVGAVKRWRVDVEDERLLAQLKEAKRSLMIEDHDIGFVFCACIHSPMLLQLEKPTIILPESGQAAYDLRFILLHELVHYKRKDLLCRLVMLLSTAIHWFNPIIYLLVKLVTIQCEMSCDEKVVEGRDIESRHQYAMAIINVARCHSKGYTLLTTYFNGGKDTMKKRITTVYDPAKKRIGVFLLACTLIMTLLAGTSIAADAREINYTLPETPVRFNEELDSYIVSWQPMDGIKEYYVGVYYNLQIEETTFKFLPFPGTEGEMTEGEPTTVVYFVADGWIGTNKVTDSAGKEYEVSDGIWDSITLKGDATEVDISSLINKQLDPIAVDYDPVTRQPVKYANKEALLGCTMVITAVRENGEPIVVHIEIPVS